MTCAEPVEVQRMVRKKVGLDFENHWLPVFVAEVPFESDGVVAQVVLPGDADVRAEDRLLTRDAVFSVDAVSGQLATAKLDHEQTEIRVLEAAGYVEDGVELMEERDGPAERFMDAWVGTYALNIVSHYEKVRKGKSLQLLQGVCEGQPVVLVGAGPSLDKNFEHLRDFPGLIFCADKAYKMLLGRGIEPDFVVSVDCHPDLIAEMVDARENAFHALILNSCADPQVEERWKGKVFWYNMKHPGVQWCDRVLPAIFPTFTGIPNVGCVGNTCLMVALHMNAGRVVLVGMDYGYTGGKMHAQRFDSKDGGEWKPIEDDHEAMIAARTGKMEVDGVVTYVGHAGYAKTAADIIDKLGLDVVNCTEGGILRGVPERPLAEEVASLRRAGFTARATRDRIAKA